MSDKLKYFENLISGAFQYLKVNYDYLYLSAMHEKVAKEGADTIILGSSHTMNGIIEEDIEGRVVNFSISSQDLYYDYLHLQKIINENSGSIQNCIISIGYYGLHWDLSSSSTVGILTKAIYEPLFNDKHNYNGSYTYRFDIPPCSPSNNENLMKGIYEEWGKKYLFENGSYYSEIKDRENNEQLGLEKSRGVI